MSCLDAIKLVQILIAMMPHGQAVPAWYVCKTRVQTDSWNIKQVKPPSSRTTNRVLETPHRTNNSKAAHHQTERRAQKSSTQKWGILAFHQHFISQNFASEASPGKHYKKRACVKPQLADKNCVNSSHGVAKKSQICPRNTSQHIRNTANNHSVHVRNRYEARIIS